MSFHCHHCGDEKYFQSYSKYLSNPTPAHGPDPYSFNKGNHCQSTWNWDYRHATPIQQVKRLPVFIADDRGRLLRRYKTGVEGKIQLNSNSNLLNSQIECRDNLPKCFVPKDDCRPRINFNKEIKKKMDWMRCQNLPVIWIYGLPQARICPIRASYAKSLAVRLDFKYIDMEEQLNDWIRMAKVLKPKDAPQVRSTRANCLRHHKNKPDYPNPIKALTPDIFLERALQMSDRIMDDPRETMNPLGVVEFLKFAILQAYPTKGYVLMNFPCSSEEADLFEKAMWPAVSGIYFQESNWSIKKNVEPQLIQAHRFRRSHYKESEVERCCDRNGYKSLKVLHSELVGESERRAMDKFIDQCILSLPCILKGERIGIIPKQELTFLDNQENPTVLEAPLPLQLPKCHGCCDPNNNYYDDGEESDDFFDNDEDDDPQMTTLFIGCGQ